MVPEVVDRTGGSQRNRALPGGSNRLSAQPTGSQWNRALPGRRRFFPCISDSFVVKC